MFFFEKEMENLALNYDDDISLLFIHPNDTPTKMSYITSPDVYHHEDTFIVTNFS